MKKKTESNSQYEKFMRMRVRTRRLKRERERLERKLKSERRILPRLQIKREIKVTKAKLRKESILRRLHCESKQEAILRRPAGINTLTRCIRHALWDFFASTRRVIHINLPPSLYDLRSLERAETGLALREWVRTRHRKRRVRKSFRI